MKKLLFFAACTVAVASCNQDAVKKAEQAALQQRDSLEQIIAQKDNEINDMMTTLSDIEEGFREITEAQNRVTLAKSGEGTNTKQRITENLQFIQSAMQQNKELINKLKQQVRESTVKGGQLKKIIDNLTQQMEVKGQEGHPYCRARRDGIRPEHERRFAEGGEYPEDRDHQHSGQGAPHGLVCLRNEEGTEGAEHP